MRSLQGKHIHLSFITLDFTSSLADETLLTVQMATIIVSPGLHLAYTMLTVKACWRHSRNTVVTMVSVP